GSSKSAGELFFSPPCSLSRAPSVRRAPPPTPFRKIPGKKKYLGASFTRVFYAAPASLPSSICHPERIPRTGKKSRDPVDVSLRFRRGTPRLWFGMTIAAQPSFLFEDFDRFPRFVGRSLFVFECALQIHLGQQIVGIEFQETR